MRILTFVSGLAVLFTTLGYAHIIHHFSMEAIRDGGSTPGFWAGIIVASGIGIMSLIGGCLLLRRSR
jgi:hypothetical protein